VTLQGDDIAITFHTQGLYQGAIAAIATGVGKVNIPKENFAPETGLLRQDRKLATLRENSVNYHKNPQDLQVKSLRWASGPLFAKLVLKVAPNAAPGDVAEYVFQIPKLGAEFTETELSYPEEPNSSDTVGAKGNAMLTGLLHLGDNPADQRFVPVPAGVRRPFRTLFNSYNSALVNAKAGLSLAAVPYTHNGLPFTGIEPDGRVFFCGPGQRTNGGSNSGTLRVFWAQMRYVFSKATAPDDLWQLYTRCFQPLTAVVDEPWATPEHLAKFTSGAAEGFWKIQYWGKPFEATLAMNYMSGYTNEIEKMLARVPGEDDFALPRLMPTREDIDGAWRKAQGAHPVDPWGLTYSTSALVPFSAFLRPTTWLDRKCASLADVSRLANGRVTAEGWPHVRSFANAFNMHVGTYLMGLWGGRKTGNRDLARWCLDATQSQNVLGTYGHGQRPYTMNLGNSDASDSLYQFISDFWLRAIELICQEDLALHPSIYGKYFDAVDVNADIYQATITETGERKPSWWRATFFRTQTHDHRWEGWAVAPYVGMFAKASDGGKVGLTEACYYMQRDVGTVPSYNSVLYFFFPGAMLKGLAAYHPVPRPPLPGDVKVAPAGGKNVVTWSPVAGDVAGYRIYRARGDDTPWTWINSPYSKMAAFVPWTNAQRPQKPKPVKKGETPVEPPAPEPYEWKIPAIPDTLVKGTTFTDPDGQPGDLYTVTAEDKAGRESRWFPNEPLPQPASTRP
jgi:hypothetical protein